MHVCAHAHTQLCVLESGWWLFCTVTVNQFPQSRENKFNILYFFLIFITIFFKVRIGCYELVKRPTDLSNVLKKKKPFPRKFAFSPQWVSKRAFMYPTFISEVGFWNLLGCNAFKDTECQTSAPFKHRPSSNLCEFKTNQVRLQLDFSNATCWWWKELLLSLNLQSSISGTGTKLLV